MNARDDARRATWPVHRQQALQLLLGWAALTVVWIGLGTLLTGSPADSSVVRTDERVSTWMAARRTPTWNELSAWGSLLSDTVTKIVVTAVVVLVFLRWWRRWFEPAVVAISLIVEAAAFIAVTTVVGRDRPDVTNLDASPVDSSFPSGHTAAAVCYGALIVVLFWHTRRRWPRVLGVAAVVLVTLIVALSRLYRGVHYLSDTIAGAALGAAAVALTVLVLARSPEGVRALHELEASAGVDAGAEIGSPRPTHEQAIA